MYDIVTLTVVLKTLAEALVGEKFARLGKIGLEGITPQMNTPSQ